MAGYYYGQLSKEKKAVYDMLAAGCDALAAVIRVPDLGTEVLSDIYLRMKLDLPLPFFVTGFHYRKYRRRIMWRCCRTICSTGER